MPPTTRVRSQVLAVTGGGRPGVYVSATLAGDPTMVRSPRPEAVTDTDGWWELDLVPNTQLAPGSFYRIREYLVGPAARAALVPDPPLDGSAVLLADIEIDPGTTTPPPTPPGGPPLYLARTELAQPDGVASLGPDRKVPATQLPAQLGPYEHPQDVPAAVWGPIVHGLGRRPTAWSLFDTDGRLCAEYEVQHLDANTVRVSMDQPTAGTIRLI